MKTAAARPQPRSRSTAGTHADRSGARPDAQHTRVLQQFRIVFNAVKAHFQQVERRAGIGGAQVWALSVVRDRPGIGVGELAEALNVRQPTASIIAKNLVQQALIEARREGQDRRNVQLHIAPAGRKVLRRAPGPYAGVLPDALQALDPATLGLLDLGLTRLISSLGADTRAATIPLSEAGPAE